MQLITMQYIFAFLLFKNLKIERHPARSKSGVHLKIYYLFRYRFLCEDHHKTVNTTGRSDWHMSKRRL